jgi:hypothetical protein
MDSLAIFSVEEVEAIVWNFVAVIAVALVVGFAAEVEEGIVLWKEASEEPHCLREIETAVVETAVRWAVDSQSIAREAPFAV